jgi:hypothetical protein
VVGKGNDRTTLPLLERKTSMRRWIIRAAVVCTLLSAAVLSGPSAQAAEPTFNLHNAMNNKCLELLSFDNANGAPAGLWDCWGGANQKWYWDGSQIRNAMNNKCLELLSFDNANGAPAGLWDCWGGVNQQWYQT